MTRAIDARTDAYVSDSAALDPLLATAIGIPGYDDQLPDLSPDGFAARESLDNAARSEVAALAPADEREALAQAAFVERTGLQVARAEAGLNRSELSVINGAPHEIRGTLDLMGTSTEAECADLAGRLAGVPLALAQYQQTLRAEAAAGRRVAVRQYVETATLIDGWTNPAAGADYFSDLVSAPGAEVPAALVTELGRSAQAARSAFAELAQMLRTELAPAAPTADGVGREHYGLASRYFLGAEVNLEETYAWGWDELHRISIEMEVAARAIAPNATGDLISAAVDLLEADPARILTSKTAFEEWMQAKSDDVLARFDGVHFDIPKPLKTLKCTVAPTNDGGAWYTPPTEDFSRPGTMWFSFTPEQTTFSTWSELTTVFHEGVPGHHLQCAQAVFEAEKLNRWQRLMCWVSGHGEGWALYAERLMDELGFFADPGERLGFLDSQSFRAARVVVDIGVHLGLKIPANPWKWREGETWDADRALEFMTIHTRMPEGQLRFEVNRYLGWPGQAPSYKVGEKIWLAARAEAQTRAGSAFDLKGWHTRALQLGSVPLDLLQSSLRG